MFHVPGRTDGGIETEQITSTVDIFPTVVDLVFGRTLPTCGKTASGSSHETQLCTEGTSLVPLIRNPHRAVKLAAYSVFSRDVMALLEDAEEARTELVSSANASSDELAVATAAVARVLPAAQQHRRVEESAHASVDLREERSQESGGPASTCFDYEGSGMGCVMGYSMQTRVLGHEFRFTEWVRFKGPSANWKPDWKDAYGAELYNHTNDGAENVNLHPRAERREPKLLRELRDRLHKGWKRNFWYDYDRYDSGVYKRRYLLRDTLSRSSSRAMDLIHQWDKAGKGEVGRDEFIRAVRSLGIDDYADEDLGDLFDELDISGSGKVTTRRLKIELKKVQGEGTAG